MAGSDWINELGPTPDRRRGPSMRRSPHRAAKARKVHAVFSFAGFVVGIIGAIWTYNETTSIALPIFVFLVAQSYIGRGLGDVATDPHKAKRFVYFTLQAVISIAVCYLTYQWWSTMWLSVLLGLTVGAFLWQLLAIILFPEIHEEEQRDSLDRLKESWQPEPGAARGQVTSTPIQPTAGDNFGEWLADRHPNITEHLFMGVVDADPERKEAMSSPQALEAWVRRHHPEVYDEWQAQAGR